MMKQWRACQATACWQSRGRRAARGEDLGLVSSALAGAHCGWEAAACSVHKRLDLTVASLGSRGRLTGWGPRQGRGTADVVSVPSRVRSVRRGLLPSGS